MAKFKREIVRKFPFAEFTKEVDIYTNETLLVAWVADQKIGEYAIG